MLWVSSIDKYENLYGGKSTKVHSCSFGRDTMGMYVIHVLDDRYGTERPLSPNELFSLTSIKRVGGTVYDVSDKVLFCVVCDNNTREIMNALCFRGMKVYNTIDFTMFKRMDSSKKICVAPLGGVTYESVFGIERQIYDGYFFSLTEDIGRLKRTDYSLYELIKYTLIGKSSHGTEVYLSNDKKALLVGVGREEPSSVKYLVYEILDDKYVLNMIKSLLKG